MARPRKIEYLLHHDGTIILPKGPPFDGDPVLIKLGRGWVEAYWMEQVRHETLEGVEYDGFCWICLDDEVHSRELDEAQLWSPLPSTILQRVQSRMENFLKRLFCSTGVR